MEHILLLPQKSVLSKICGGGGGGGEGGARPFGPYAFAPWYDIALNKFL